MGKATIPIISSNEFDNALPEDFGFDKYDPLSFLMVREVGTPLAQFIEDAASEITDYIFDEVSNEIDWQAVESTLYEKIMTKLYSYAAIATAAPCKGDDDE